MMALALMALISTASEEESTLTQEQITKYWPDNGVNKKGNPITGVCKCHEYPKDRAIKFGNKIFCENDTGKMCEHPAFAIDGQPVCTRDQSICRKEKSYVHKLEKLGLLVSYSVGDKVAVSGLSDTSCSCPSTNVPAGSAVGAEMCQFKIVDKNADLNTWTCQIRTNKKCNKKKGWKPCTNPALHKDGASAKHKLKSKSGNVHKRKGLKNEGAKRIVNKKTDAIKAGKDKKQSLEQCHCTNYESMNQIGKIFCEHPTGTKCFRPNVDGKCPTKTQSLCRRDKVYTKKLESTLGSVSFELADEVAVGENENTCSCPAKNVPQGTALGGKLCQRKIKRHDLNHNTWTCQTQPENGCDEEKGWMNCTNPIMHKNGADAKRRKQKKSKKKNAKKEAVKPVMMGAKRDQHGCIPSAGYMWSEEKKECVRSWEEAKRDVESEKTEL